MNNFIKILLLVLALDAINHPFWHMKLFYSLKQKN